MSSIATALRVFGLALVALSLMFATGIPIASAQNHDSSATNVVAAPGDRNNVVWELQYRLNEVGFDAGPVDGIYGQLTENGVNEFQAAVGLEPTGVYDEATAEALSSYDPTDDDTSTMTIREAQRLLNRHGFDAGPVDGIYGPLTAAGLEAFQREVDLPVTGRLDQATIEALLNYDDGSDDGDNGDDDDDDTDPVLSMSVREAQRLLNRHGFDAGPVDGIYGTLTENGLEEFQRTVGLPTTGRLDQPTIRALTNYDGGDSDQDESVTASAQRALADGPFDPGPIDGVYGPMTEAAIWALEKLAELPMDGDWDRSEQDALARVTSGELGRSENSFDRRWVEVDISDQLVYVYDPGQTTPVLISHTSTGSEIPWSNDRFSGDAVTPTGTFEILWRVDGWRQSSLDIGGLYNPLYITHTGIALHGARSVPTYPASHGCIRLPMHIAEYLPSMLPNGTPVVVRD